MRRWLLSEANYQEIQSRPYETAVLPLGATEPHNLHLPYGTDTFQVDVLGERACAQADGRGARVVMLPAMPYGTETNLKRFPLAMNVNPTTLSRVIADLVESLENSGVRKCVLLNGHGGNDLKWMLREFYGKTSVHLFLCDWWRMIADCCKSIFEDPGDHAGDLETSLMMAFRPDLVFLNQADDGAMAKTQLEAVNRGWISITRPWHLLTTNTGAGNPKAATPEKGARIAEAIVERLANFLVELDRTPVDEQFPYPPKSS